MSTMVYDKTAAQTEIARAAELIRGGHLVAFPTETVYGLGADATNGAAVARIFEVKRRPQFNPLIAHVPDAATAERFAEITGVARSLIAAFWPGPLTVVVPLRPGAGISSLVTAGLDTIALRAPAHPLARRLLQEAGRPIAAPSANISGQVSPTRAEHVRAAFGDEIPLVMDGGPCTSGLESTIVDCTGYAPVLLRPGTITRRNIERVIDQPLAEREPQAVLDTPNAPGQLRSHYAPQAPVRLSAAAAREGEAFIGFGPEMRETNGPSINLSPSGELREAAANLFDALRQMDQAGITAIAVMPIPNEGIGEAINDRLQRAAAPRDAVDVS